MDLSEWANELELGLICWWGMECVGRISQGLHVIFKTWLGIFLYHQSCLKAQCLQTCNVTKYQSLVLKGIELASQYGKPSW